VILGFIDDQMSAFACGQDVFAEIDRIDGFPDLNRRCLTFLIRERGISMEV
jgi:hypothetical protein